MGELEQSVTSAEFSEWQAYSRIEPFGERRADQRAWLQVAMLANVHRDTKTTGPISLKSVLPEWQAPVDPLDQWRAFDRQMRSLEGE